MSLSSETNMDLMVVLSVTGLLFTAHHAWRFDKCRCLLPTRKEWFRVLLTWMLIASNIGMLIWGGGWSYVKHDLGWMVAPQYGAMPIPPQLWKKRYRDLNQPLTFWVNLAYCLQVSLNAEEGLYWYVHPYCLNPLLPSWAFRATFRPWIDTWLTSSFFFTWIGISVASVIAQFGVGWINEPDIATQMARMFTCGGSLELAVVLASLVVISKFPAFLRDVKHSGAGAEVRSRLHFYHEANKVRTFFRILFTICTLTLGIDGLTKEKRVFFNHLACDLLQQIAFGSYFFASIISVILYLPRNWSKATSPGQIMVGAAATPPRMPTRDSAGQIASQALMSLLREGGQWDDVDDAMATKTRVGSRAFGDMRGWGEDVEVQSPPTRIPQALENWSSPFGLQTHEQLPSQIHIRVEQEVHEDKEGLAETRA